MSRYLLRNFLRLLVVLIPLGIWQHAARNLPPSWIQAVPSWALLVLGCIVIAPPLYFLVRSLQDPYRHQFDDDDDAGLEEFATLCFRLTFFASGVFLVCLGMCQMLEASFFRDLFLLGALFSGIAGYGFPGTTSIILGCLIVFRLVEAGGQLLLSWVRARSGGLKLVCS